MPVAFSYKIFITYFALIKLASLTTSNKESILLNKSKDTEAKLEDEISSR